MIMARLASQAKAGFYPTPDSVCALLKEKLEFEPGARLLDPCCGYGNTLFRLAGSDTITYGIELDHHRATQAKTRLFQAVWGDSLTEARVSSQAFGLLYLNPPYDNNLHAEDDKHNRRLELQFLKAYQRTLQMGGILIFVIPYYVLRHCAETLARNFKVMVAQIPEEDFPTFKQCVVFGRKKYVSEKDAKETQAHLEALAALTPEQFLEQSWTMDMVLAPLIIPAATKPVSFRIDRLDPLEAIPVISKAGILTDALKSLVPAKNNQIRPLTSLENGHLALMLAGGYMNGAIKKDGREIVIKGVVRKTEKVIQTHENGSGGGTITTKDQYIPTVKVIDMQTAELITVQ
jgi:SAM-dependent methyltransferase